MITTSTNKNTRHENAVNLGLSASNKVHCIVKQLDAKQLLAMHSNHHAEHQKCRNFLAIYSQTVHVSTDIEQLARTMLCLLVFSWYIKNMYTDRFSLDAITALSFFSALWHCWFGNRKGFQPVNSYSYYSAGYASQHIWCLSQARIKSVSYTHLTLPTIYSV